MNEEEEFLPGGFGELLRQAQEMQDHLAQVQGSAAEEVVEGHAGGGAVSVTVNGAMEFLAVHIDPEAVDPGDVGMLEDLVLAAVRDAVDQVRALTFSSAGGLGGLLGDAGAGLGGLLGGAGAGLGGLLGGAGAGLGGLGGLEDLVGGGGADLMGPLQEMLQGLMGEGGIELEEGDPDDGDKGGGADPG